jgi:hypothetical protein
MLHSASHNNIHMGTNCVPVLVDFLSSEADLM